MITIYRRSDAGLTTVERPEHDCWIDVSNPTPDEAKRLTEELKIPPEFVAYSLNPDKIPLVEQENGALFILARIADAQDSAAAIPFLTVPLGIVVTDGSVVTICRRRHELLRDLPHEQQIDLTPTCPTRFVLHLLWSIANDYLDHLNRINKAVEELEDQLQRSLQNREVLELLRYQKSLVHFTTALRANHTMLERLRRSEFLKMERQDEDLLDDVFTETQQVIGMTDVANNILSQMMDAFASIISNNLNVVMKFLASVTVVLILPTVVGTFYGMNVRLPLEGHPHAFTFLLAASIVCSLIVAAVFWRKKWL
jgi:magnesium transporter